ncbi:MULTISPECIES: winged helix-turn-helix domain-containing protein [Actinosynnema]|uniref:ArsR/SmtB family transcription factor n=1 Tax=Actinosynnema TaxID=40566 RepID=UPI0020A33FAE|nr:winged helix-turn-helix domain-containing protein [Actinosynnema pretiosum]MCP2093214.1 Helix-turn-helix domain-containing protein [Actinosynnema pretiosum]
MGERVATQEEAAALASAVRLRIIRMTHHRALTNKELARQLGKDPATVLHHVRKLVATGFLEAQPPRAGNRGAKEIPYLSTGLSWRLSWSEEHPSVGEALLEAFLGEVADAGVDRVEQTRLVARADQQELMGRFRALLDELADRPADPDAEHVAIYLAVYPAD